MTHRPTTASAIRSTAEPVGSRLLWSFALACTILLLGGCAAENAYRAGRELSAAGRTAEAIRKFDEAARLDSASAQYRIAASQTREALIIDLIAKADKAFAAGDLEEAGQGYRRVLEIQPANHRAIDGFKLIEATERHNKWMVNAQKAVERKDDKNAQLWARMVVAEDTTHRKALALLQDIEQRSAKNSTGNVLADALRKPITIEFKDAPLKTVFEVVSRTSGLNFLFDKDVRTDQRTSIFLRNSSIESAINLTLMSNQLEQRVLDANTVMIYPNTAAKQKDYQALTVKTFYLANADAKNVAATLKTILKTRDVVVDEKLNMLILRDTPDAIRLAEKLVALHDVAEPEVMLEVEILEVTRTRLLDLGIRWPDQLALSPLASANGALTLADLRNLNGTSVGATIGATTITAKNTDTYTNILANPRIRARNREKAKILIGERVPNITTTSTASGFVAESINYVDVGLKLDVEPIVYPDGDVAIRIAMEVSNIVSQLQTKLGSVAYQIGTRTAQTMLRLKDGENQVLAGLINDEDRRTANKVPGLGGIPVVGRLFGNQADNTTKNEIILSITPRILRNIQRPPASITEFDSGTESTIGGGSVPTSNASTSGGAVSNWTGSLLTGQRTEVSAPRSDSVNAGVADSSVTPSDSGGKLATTGTALTQWQGPAKVKYGDVFSVQLLMQSDQPLVSIPLAIKFDPSALQVTSITEGDFLKQGGAGTSFTSRVDPSSGQILITDTRSGGSGATSLGSIANLNFRAIATAATSTVLQIQTIAPVVLGGGTINSPPPPNQVISLTPQ